MNYRWVSDSTYEFTWSSFTYGTGPPAGPFIMNPDFYVSSQSLNINYLVNVNWTSISPIWPFPMLYQPSDPENCSEIRYKSGGTEQLAFDEYILRRQITLPGRADDWVFTSYGREPFTEYSNVDLWTHTGDCGLNNLDFPDSVAKNNSPMWMNRFPTIPGYLHDTLESYPIIPVCRNRTYVLDQKVTEYQGDIIRYEFPRHGIFGDTVSKWVFLNGFSLDYMLPNDTPPPFSIDSITGEIFYKPIRHNLPGAQWKDLTNFYTVPIMAREYRMDTTWIGGNPVVKRKQIGYVTRTITIVVTPDSLCADSNVAFADTTDHLPTTSIDLYCNDNPFKISFTDPIRCNTVDSNGSSFVLVEVLSGDTINIVRAEAECRHDNIADNIRIYTDTILSAWAHYLYLKTGDDGNTLITQCGSEIIAGIGDTLAVFMNGGPGPVTFQNDSLGNNTSYLDVECRSTNFTVFTSYPIRCNTARKNGSDFYLVDSSGTSIIQIPIVKVERINCTYGFTSELLIKLDRPIDPGNYKLYLQQGDDGNTLIDACHRKWPFMHIDVPIKGPQVDLGEDIEVCSRDAINITLSAPAGYSYKWNDGSFQRSIQVNDYGTYWVEVWSNKGCVGRDTILIKKIICTGIAEVNSDQKLSVYPNPASNKLYIEYKGKQAVEKLEILDNSGKIILQITDKQHLEEIDISSLTNGLYLLSLYFENNTGIKQRFVKANAR